MKKIILTLLALGMLSCLQAEELVTERIRIGRGSEYALWVGYLKYYTDKYPALLNEELLNELTISVPAPKIYTYQDKKSKDSTYDPFIPQQRRILRPELERCVSDNSESRKKRAALIVNTFELHGVEFTSIKNAKLTLDDSFGMVVTNTKDNIARMRELFQQFVVLEGTYPMTRIKVSRDSFAPD